MEEIMPEPVDALEKMNTAVNKARRLTSVPFPVVFMRRDQAQADPFLAQLMRGGRGGEVRLRLYLTMRMQATRHPFEVPRATTRGRAVMLALSPNSGHRQISKALSWLENEKLARIERPAGEVAKVVLLYPDGNGKDWPKIDKDRYVAVPIQLWKNGWILKLSGRSLAIYLILLELTGGALEGEWKYLPAERKRQYGLSDDTWTRALKELLSLGLIIVDSELYGDYDLETRVRKRYRVTKKLEDAAPSW
ncbi:hypothetical protein [Arthrobacter sp. UYCu723]